MHDRFLQVTEAICTQLQTLNTNSRFLHGGLTTYTRALLETMDKPLDVSALSH
jgi:hypothetical protein